jgi:hypothetical protein
MKQHPWDWRLRAMQAPSRRLAIAVLRTGLMVALAVLLILGLLPAAIAAQANSN